MKRQARGCPGDAAPDPRGPFPDRLEGAAGAMHCPLRRGRVAGPAKPSGSSPAAPGCPSGAVSAGMFSAQAGQILRPPGPQWHSFSGGGLRYRFARLENGRASHFFLLGLQRSSGLRETRG